VIAEVASSPQAVKPKHADNAMAKVITNISNFFIIILLK
jgi:hypothetical protein